MAINNGIYQPQMSYGMNYGYSGAPAAPVYPQQSYGQAPVRMTAGGNILGYQVDGEIGAKAFPFQTGSTEPVALWDLNDSVFYLRTYNQAGFPNPLEKYRFVKEEIMPALPAGQSGAAQSIDTSGLVTKAEFDGLRQEIRDMRELLSSPNTNQNGGNRNNNQGRQP